MLPYSSRLAVGFVNSTGKPYVSYIVYPISPDILFLPSYISQIVSLPFLINILENIFDGRALELSYAKETLRYVQELWGHRVKLITKGTDNQEIIVTCDQDKKITIT